MSLKIKATNGVDINVEDFGAGKPVVFIHGWDHTLYHLLIVLIIFANWAQGDLNPRPTAPQAAILSKLNYGPKLF